jgi:uncharacterized protein (TIGR03905 family)
MSNPSFKIITNTLIGTSRHIIAETSHEVCSSHIEIWLSNDTITSVKFVRGCSGNTQCIAALIEGMNVNDVINNIEYETLKAEILAYYKKGLESELNP